ncbi:MAG: autotransporter-associated beta strand repeat-containing protein [Planctomycetia bacterium]|nr:autotransporter-associated beta strand repeat-containing protein [Planctomycetia bacterium]
MNTSFTPHPQGAGSRFAGFFSALTHMSGVYEHKVREASHAQRRRSSNAWAGIFAALLFAVGATSMASAEIIESGSAFSGSIAANEVINLIGPDGSIDGDVINDGELWFNNPDIASQTVASSISGSGLVVVWQPVTVTFSGTNTYAGGTILYDGTTAIASGGSISHSSANFDIDGVAGTLLTINGSLSNFDANLGVSARFFGDAIVGPGASWTTARTLYAGVSGTSVVTITGGTTSANQVYFGYNGGSSGTLSLSDGTLVSTDSMFFGYFGDASFQVTGGSLASANDLFVGYGPGSASGSVTSGTLSAAKTLTVGNSTSGTGTLLINGGYVTGSTVLLGQSSGGVGTVTVTTGTLAAISDLQVGSTTNGVGTLNLNGGVVTSPVAYIGNLGGSRGTVNVSAGSLTLSSTIPDGNLQVGYSGNGFLNVTGGTVFAIGGNIGWSSSGSGTASVSGGSLTITDLLNIGKSGNGTLLVSSGTLTTGQVILGDGNHLGIVGSGSAQITGGRWSNSLSLTVGNLGNGTMNVSGGYVTAANGFVGSSDTLATAGVGSLTVTGGTVAFAGNLTVGNDRAGSTGAGTLTVSGSSGLVTVNDTLSRAANGAINLNAGGTLSIGTGGPTGSLTTGLVNNGLLIFNRSTNYTYGSVISGSGSFIKRGAAALTLTGTSTYSSTTTVEAGTLVLAGALGLTEMTVQSGATLAGGGSSLGGVSILDGGLITPGANTIATLTLGSLSLSGSGATSAMQITGSSLGGYDQILAQSGSSSSLSWGTSTIQISMSTTPSYDEGTLFYLYQGFSQYTGNLSGITLNAVGTDFAGLTFVDTLGNGIWQTGRNASNLGLKFDTTTGILAVVPEPSTLVLCFAGLGVVGFLRHRQRRRAKAASQSMRIGSLPGCRDSSS